MCLCAILMRHATARTHAQETRKLLDAVLSIQPRIASSGAAAAGGKSLDEQVLELACSIEVGATTLTLMACWVPESPHDYPQEWLAPRESLAWHAGCSTTMFCTSSSRLHHACLGIFVQADIVTRQALTALCTHTPRLSCPRRWTVRRRRWRSTPLRRCPPATTTAWVQCWRRWGEGANAGNAPCLR